MSGELEHHTSVLENVTYIQSAYTKAVDVVLHRFPFTNTKQVPYVRLSPLNAWIKE